MIFELSNTDAKEPPALILKTLADDVIAPIGFAYNIEININYNDYSVLSFDVPKYANGEETEAYDKIVGMNVVNAVGYGTYILSNPERVDEGISETKHCTAYSLEYELSFKFISLSNGTYNFYNSSDPTNTIIGMLLEAIPSWSINSIDSSLEGRYRTLEIDGVSIYDLIKNTLQEKYGCVFNFDTYNRTISVVSTSSEVDTTPVYLSAENLAKSISVTEESENIITCMDVSGAEDIDIRSVNPMGINKIYDLDHFMTTDYFSQEMINKWNLWKDAFSSNQEAYYNKTIELNLQISNLAIENAALTDLYGNLSALENVQAAIISGISAGTHSQSDLNSKNEEISSKKEEISSKESLIETIEGTIESIRDSLSGINQATAFSQFFTNSEILSLKRYFFEGSLRDETFVAPATTSYSNEDVSGPVTSGSISIEGSEVESAVSETKTVYSFFGGTINGLSCSSKLIRGCLEAGQNGSLLFTAYLDSGTYGSTSFTSGCISASGSGSVTSSTEDGIVVSVESGNVLFTKNATEYEKQAIKWDLYEYARGILSERAQPKYSFTLDSANFLASDDFEDFKNAICVGKRVYVNIGGEVLTPYLLSITINFDSPENFSMSFGNEYTSTNKRFSLADLIEQSISVGRATSISKSEYGKFVDSGAATAVKQYMESSLDIAKNPLISSGLQAVTYDDTGIRLRKWSDNAHSAYSGQEIWMVNNNILFTEDNWSHAKMAIGEIVSPSDSTRTVYGIIAPYLVGEMIAGSNLKIESEKTSGGTAVFKVDQDGCSLYNSVFDLKESFTKNSVDYVSHISLHPNYGVVGGSTVGTSSIYVYDASGDILGVRSYKSGCEDIAVDSISALSSGYEPTPNFWIDMAGDVWMRGTITASNISGSTIKGGEIQAPKIKAQDDSIFLYFNTVGDTGKLSVRVANGEDEYDALAISNFSRFGYNEFYIASSASAGSTCFYIGRNLATPADYYYICGYSMHTSPIYVQNSIASPTAVTEISSDGISIGGNAVPAVVAESIASETGAWSYRKWANGVLECWIRIDVSADANVALSTWYRTGNLYAVDDYVYPVAFTAEPIVNMQYFTTNGTGGLVWPNTVAGTSPRRLTNLHCAFIVRPTATTIIGYLDVFVVGKWN